MGRKKGQTKDICGGMMANGINVCQAKPGAGTDHLGYGRCKWHGGATPTGYKAAGRQEALQRSREFGVPTANVDPADVMRQELARTNDLVTWARDMCQNIINQAETNFQAKHTNSSSHDPSIPDPMDIIDDHRFMGYKVIMDDERDRLMRIARSAMDVSINARKQALAEALAAVVIDCFHAMTRSIPDLTQHQMEAAQSALKEELAIATQRLLLPAAGQTS